MKNQRQFLKELELRAKGCQLILKGIRVIVNTDDIEIKQLCQKISLIINKMCLRSVVKIKKHKDDCEFRKIMRNLGL